MRRATPFLILSAALALAFALAFAFVLTPAIRATADEPAKKLQVVAVRDDGVEAAAINNQGHIVGLTWVEEKNQPDMIVQSPFYAKGSGQEMFRLPMLDGYTSAFPVAISDGGAIVGRMSKPFLGPNRSRVYLSNQAFVWDEKSGMRGLGAPKDDWASFASDITRDGRVISGYAIGDNRIRPCLWERDEDGKDWRTIILPHTDRLGSHSVVISDDGKRVAAADGPTPYLWTRLGPNSWSYEALGGPGEFVPRAVNNQGTVVGVAYTVDGIKHAVVWTRESGLKRLQLPPKYKHGEANGINNQGAVVGLIDGPEGSPIGPNAFVFEQGRLRIIDEGGPNFVAANAINDQGQVTGTFEKDEDEPENGEGENDKKKADVEAKKKD